MDITEVKDNRKVYLSNRLIEASYRLEVNQQRFIRVLASMVKKSDEDLKSYDFKISDIMDIFEIKNRGSYKTLPMMIAALQKNVIKFYNGEEYITVPWLAFSRCTPGTGIISVQFHPFLKPLYIGLGTEFTQYELNRVLKFKSTYSYRIYELLKQVKKIGWRKIEIKDLRFYLNLEENEYEKYNDLKRFAIIPAQKEFVKCNSDILFDFEEIKKGRKVTALKFIIKVNSNMPQEETNGDQEDEDLVPEYRIEDDEDPLSEIRRLIKEPLTDRDIKTILKAANNNIDLVKEKYELAQKSESPIRKLVAWMIKAIKEDYQENDIPLINSNKKSKKPKQNFKGRAEEDPDYVEKIKEALDQRREPIENVDEELAKLLEERRLEQESRETLMDVAE